MSLTAIEPSIHRDKNVTPGELSALMSAVGWDNGSGQGEEGIAVLRGAIDGTGFIAHARDDSGKLIGYVSVLSDGVFTAFIDMILVHPEAQRQGLATALIHAVEEHFKGVPLYAMPFADMHELFLKAGYADKTRKFRTMVPVSKRNP